MDINKKQNLLRLWLESFVVVNQCTGKLIKAVLCLLVVVAVILTILILAMGGTAVLNHLQMMANPQIAGIGTGLLYMGSSLLGNLLFLFFMTVIFQIIATQVLQVKQPLTETFSSSVWPTIYQIVASFLLVIPVVIASIILAVLTKGNQWAGLIGLILIAFLSVRICYSFIAIAVDNKGPIEGLVHSWNLTKGSNYVDALLMCLMLVGSVFLLYALMFGLGYVLYIAIPLYFPNSFNLAHPSLIWWLLLLVLMVLGIFYYMALLAFPILVYLNRNAQENPVKQQQTKDDEIFIPLPELETPGTAQAAPSPVTPQTPTPAETPHTQTPPAGMEILGVTKTSVNTTEAETNDLSQHLDQVYTPRDKEIAQHKEEDRMPTILFDDELAKQLEGQFLAEQQPKPAPKEDGNSSGDDPIQLSK